MAAQPLLDRTPAPLAAPRPAPTPPPLLGAAPGTPPARPHLHLEDVPATEGVLRLRHSAQAPTDAHLRRAAASARSAGTARIGVDVPVVLVPDEAAARRTRGRLALLDAMAGLGWSPSASWLVTTPHRLADEALALAARVGADHVVLHPDTSSRALLALP